MDFSRTIGPLILALCLLAGCGQGTGTGPADLEVFQAEAVGDLAPGPRDLTPGDGLDAADSLPKDAPSPDLEAGDLAGAELPDSAAPDAGPDTVQLPCGGLCSAFQLCNEDSDECEANPACQNDFCTPIPQDLLRVEGPDGPFYMDPFEWPNQQGQVPLGGLTSKEEAEALCHGVGKRLCSSTEFTAVCSKDHAPYPYGLDYDPFRCHTELPFSPAPAGSFPGCHPTLPIFDLVGNLGEWTSDGFIFGGTALDGANANCQSVVMLSGSFAHPELLGLRCCLAPKDDADGDGWQASLDCDDQDNARSPEAAELCNDLDDNCDGLTDNAADKDKDGYNLCQDCNDNSASFNPGADDQAGDGFDLNCDGVDGLDADGDGFVATATGGDDCDDSRPEVHPGAPELCDGLDNDCDQEVDTNLADGLCDDQNPCTADTCTAATGDCVHNPVKCSDNNPCTDDSCSPASGCVFTNNTAACNDGQVCTKSDQCSGGICVGTAANCDDQNPCTEDSCHPTTGLCKHLPISGDCENGNLCNTGDSCVDGKCKAGTGVLDCDDDNPCTDDLCVPATGCKWTNNQVFCDDGDACTSQDQCRDGVCLGGSNSCLCNSNEDCDQFNDADWCNGYLFCDKSLATPVCKVKPDSVVFCSDSGDSFCRQNLCNPLVGLCAMTPRNEGQGCDDGDGCTLSDVCVAGQCKGSTCGVLGMQCLGNECVSKICTAGENRCMDNSSYRTCLGAGLGWSDPKSCGASSYCKDGTCHLRVCLPNQPSCLGDLAGTCDALGSGLLGGGSDCALQDRRCRLGQCVDEVPCNSNADCEQSEYCLRDETSNSARCIPMTYFGFPMMSSLVKTTNGYFGLNELDIFQLDYTDRDFRVRRLADFLPGLSYTSVAMVAPSRDGGTVLVNAYQSNGSTYTLFTVEPKTLEIKTAVDAGTNPVVLAVSYDARYLIFYENNTSTRYRYDTSTKIKTSLNDSSEYKLSPINYDMTRYYYTSSNGNYTYYTEYLNMISGQTFLANNCRRPQFDTDGLKLGYSCGLSNITVLDVASKVPKSFAVSPASTDSWYPPIVRGLDANGGMAFHGSANQYVSYLDYASGTVSLTKNLGWTSYSQRPATSLGDGCLLLWGSVGYLLCKTDSAIDSISLGNTIGTSYTSLRLVSSPGVIASDLRYFWSDTIYTSQRGGGITGRTRLSNLPLGGVRTLAPLPGGGYLTLCEKGPVKYDSLGVVLDQRDESANFTPWSGALDPANDLVYMAAQVSSGSSNYKVSLYTSQGLKPAVLLGSVSVNSGEVPYGPTFLMPDLGRLLVGARTRFLVFSANSGAVMKNAYLGTNVQAGAYDQPRRLFYLGLEDGTLQVYDANTMEKTKELKLASRINSLAVDSSNGNLAVGLDRFVQVLSPSLTVIHTINGSSGVIALEGSVLYLSEARGPLVTEYQLN